MSIVHHSFSYHESSKTTSKDLEGNYERKYNPLDHH
nr:MAG TPA: hypothetical protein [Caudoviricetes sp.]